MTRKNIRHEDHAWQITPRQVCIRTGIRLDRACSGCRGDASVKWWAVPPYLSPLGFSLRFGRDACQLCE